MSDAGATRVGVVGVIPRAAFLACSWTWCIGMYLPVILVRDFGIAGWVVFAIPNVVGAAALPFVLRTPEASERYAARHATAMRWFSAATIAYQSFFLVSVGRFAYSAWVGAGGWGALGYSSVVGCGLAVAAAWAGGAAARRSGAWWGRASCVALVASAALLAATLAVSPALTARAAPRAAPVDLVFLIPLMSFGFLCCPYLDATFHRVRREAPGRAGRAAFTLGFGVFFLAMIIGSVLYADRGRMLDFTPWLVAHMWLQCAFTIGAHRREWEADGPSGSRAARAAPALSLGGVGVPSLAGIALGLTASFSGGAGWFGFEEAYLTLLALYALPFPVYVWIGWGARDDARSRSVGMAVTGVATLIAAPMLWLGFIEKQWFWLAPAAILAVLSRPVAMALSRAKDAR